MKVAVTWLKRREKMLFETMVTPFTCRNHRVCGLCTCLQLYPGEVVILVPPEGLPGSAPLILALPFHYTARQTLQDQPSSPPHLLPSSHPVSPSHALLALLPLPRACSRPLPPYAPGCCAPVTASPCWPPWKTSPHLPRLSLGLCVSSAPWT